MSENKQLIVLLMVFFLKNGDMKHWTVEGNIKVCDGGYDTDTCFVTSDVWCSKYQEVDLLKHFTSEYLDTAPDIMVWSNL